MLIGMGASIPYSKWNDSTVIESAVTCELGRR